MFFVADESWWEPAKAWARSLKRDESVVVGTLRFLKRTDVKAAKRKFEAWTKEVEVANGRKFDSCLSELHLRSSTDSQYIHVLICGLKPARVRLAIDLWMPGEASLRVVNRND